MRIGKKNSNYPADDFFFSFTHFVNNDYHGTLLEISYKSEGRTMNNNLSGPKKRVFDSKQ